MAWRIVVAAAVGASLAGGCGKDPGASARRHLRTGDEYAQAGKYKDASIEYRNAARDEPQSAEAHEKLADAAARTGDPNTALVEMLRVAELKTGDVTAQVRASSIYLLAGQYEQARERAEAALHVNTGDVAARIALSEALAALGDAKSSEDRLVEAVKISPRSVEAHVALGGRYWSRQRVRDAEAEFSRAVQLAPANAAANRALALLFMATGRGDRAELPWRVVSLAPDGDPFALADYESALGRDDKAEDLLETLAAQPATERGALIRLAGIQYSRGKGDAAYRTLDTLLARDSRNLEGLLLRGQLLMADRRPDEALRMFQSAAQVDPSPRVLALEGSAYLERRDQSRAEAAFNAALAKDRNDGAATLGLARLRLEQDRADEAIDLADRARERWPADFGARQILIAALGRSGQIDRALQEARAAATVWPSVAAAHGQFGAAELAAGDMAGARRSFARALELDANYLPALAGLTIIDLETKSAPGSAGKTEAALRQAIEANPSDLQAYEMLGQLYLSERRLDAARDEFARLAERAANASPETMVGMIEEAQGRPADAREAYERTLAKYPRAGVAANNLACLLADEGQLAKALDLARIAHEELPHVPEVNDTLGWIYYRNNQPREAIETLSQSIDARPRESVYRYHRAVAYLKVGLTKAAREDLTLALANTSPFLGRDEAVKAARQIGAAVAN